MRTEDYEQPQASYPEMPAPDPTQGEEAYPFDANMDSLDRHLRGWDSDWIEYLESLEG